MAHLRTTDGTEFLFVAIHLHRRSAAKRLSQARQLRDWASEQQLPIVATGDFNFDYEVPNGPGNAAFDELALGGVFEWEKPNSLVATQFSDSNSDGINDHNSVLDFFWTANTAQQWTSSPEIVVRSGDFPDDNQTSDHRPIAVTLNTSAPPSVAAARPARLRIASSRTVHVPVTGGVAGDPSADREHGASQEQPVATLGQGASGFGRFEGRVVASWDGAGREMTLLEPFHYVDQHGARWTAENGSKIDGASIPKAFWSIIGGPFEGRYRNASVVHDIYCDQRTKSWKDVHRMFYEACRCGGVSATKAKLMYYAVYHFGPRWGDAAARMSSSAQRPLDESEVEALRAYIEFRAPTLEELETLPPTAFGKDD